MNGARLSRVVLVSAVLATGAFAQDRPSGAPGTVTLRLSEYENLLDRAAKPPKGTEQPPFDAVVARATMKLRVADDFVRGTFKLEGEVFRKGPARIPLIAGATLMETTLQNATPPLVLENGRHSAILVGPRPFEMDLLWGSPVVTEPGRASVYVPLPIAGSVSFTIDLPGEVSDVRVEPGLVTRKTTNAGRTIVEASPDRAAMVRVSWAARAAATAPRESRFLSDLKTLMTVDENELRMTALVDINVVQGQPDRLDILVPNGWTLTTATGATLDSFSLPAGHVLVNLRETERRAHQILLGFERPLAGLSFPTELGLLSIRSAQRETGEVAIEGIGTLELNADEKGPLKRMDAREAHPALRGLAREAILAAFRYHARADESLVVPVDVKRFAESATLAAIADHAQATSLVTTEGRVLTEMKLTVKNHAQPFLRVVLPAGATVLSAEVQGESVKPAMGSDGTRIPLLRAGFRPTGSYSVSFVYLQTADAFTRKGDGRMTLPRLDVPVGLVDWDVFLPDVLQVKDFGGNVAKAGIWDESVTAGFAGGGDSGVMGGILGGDIAPLSMPKPVRVGGNIASFGEGGSGRLFGRVVDTTGAPIPGATVSVIGDGFVRTATSANDGGYFFDDLPNRDLRVTRGTLRLQNLFLTPERRDRRAESEYSPLRGRHGGNDRGHGGRRRRAVIPGRSGAAITGSEERGSIRKRRQSPEARRRCSSRAHRHPARGHGLQLPTTARGRRGIAAHIQVQVALTALSGAARTPHRRARSQRPAPAVRDSARRKEHPASGRGDSPARSLRRAGRAVDRRRR